MRLQHDVRHIGPAHRRRRLVLEHVQRRSAKPSFAQSRDQRILHHQLPARDIHQPPLRSHTVHPGSIDPPALLLHPLSRTTPALTFHPQRLHPPPPPPDPSRIFPR